MNFLQLACLVTVCIAAVIDARTRKIPNWLTFPGALLALIMQFALNQNWHGLLIGTQGWLAGAALVLVSSLTPRIIGRYKQGPIGFGDVKLMAMVGAWLGPLEVCLAFYFFCLFYGLFAGIKLLRALPWNKLTALGAAGVGALTAEELEKFKTMMRSHIPLGPAIALGTLSAILFFKPLMGG